MPATWTAPDGTVHTGRIQVATGDAAAGGLFVALGGWAGAVALLAAVQGFVHAGLNRRRYRVWDSKLARV